MVSHNLCDHARVTLTIQYKLLVFDYVPHHFIE